MKDSSKTPSVFLAIPTRGQVIHATMIATHRMGRTPVYSIRSRPSSLLTAVFNILWCEALNERENGITHFVMMHDDIEPLDDNWLDTLLAEHEKIGADITNVLSPIKDERGLLSTAMMDPKTRRMKMLTVRETLVFPPTFTAASAGFPGQVILPNTGLWICDFTKLWVEEICFTIRDRINRSLDGKVFQPQCFSEDWHFGLQAAKLGLTVAATTAVRILHHGTFRYPNFTPWGDATNDAEPIFNPKEDDVNVTPNQLFASIGEKQMEIELLRAENLQLLAANKALTESALQAAAMPESLKDRSDSEAALANGEAVKN